MATIIFDHDVGTNPDDFFSLLMLLNSREVNLSLVISGNNFPKERALLAKKIIKQHGNNDVIVVSGEAAGNIDFNAHDLIGDFEADISSDYKREIKRVLDTSDEVTYVCVQGTANISGFLKEYPEYADTFQIVHMGMSLNDTSEFVGGGTNMEADAYSAKYLYELGLKRLRVVGSHTTINDMIRVHPGTALYKKLSESNDANHVMLVHHVNEYHRRRGIWPALHDPLATSVALGCQYVDFEEVGMDFDANGKYRKGTMVRVIISRKEINDAKSFMEFCAELI